MRLLRFFSLIIGLLAFNVNAELIHRYEFDGDCLDSIGDADAKLTLRQSGAYYSSGALVLGNSSTPASNANVNYIDLPDGIISSAGNAITIEAWVYWSGPSDQTDQNFFTFGTSDVGEDISSTALYSDFMFLSPARFTNRSNISSGESIPKLIIIDSFPLNQYVHVAVVFDDTAGLVKLYKNAELVGSCEAKFTLPELNDINNWIGRSQWDNMQGFYGRIAEFRIYNNALTDEMILAEKNAGPNSIGAEQYLVPATPYPAHNQASWQPPISLLWQPGSGENIAEQNLYFGTDYLGVLQADKASTEFFKGTLSTSADEYTLAENELTPGTKYFWRIECVTSDGYKFSSPAWSFNYMKKPISCMPGDISGDCMVDLSDLVELSEQWLATVDCDAYDCADFDNSHMVDLVDFIAMSENWQEYSDPLVVINEINYHPDENTEPVEFIELYHAGAQALDLNGWTISGGISYTFDNTAILNPGGYIVVSQNPDAVMAKYGIISYGPFEGKLSNDGEGIILRDNTGNKIDEVNYASEFPWPIAANGEGASMELINPYLDNDLSGSWRSSGFGYNLPEFAHGEATPGMINSVFSINIPPQVRQVNNYPNQPLETEATTITAKITDIDGVDSVTLKYQIVLPGAYLPAYLPIEINTLYDDPVERHPVNPDFEDPANWITVAMADDGTGMDEVAGDNIYTAQIPAQINRTVVRYRIETSDTLGNEVRVPYYDDESLNFAYYVYNGVPDYVTTNRSVSGSAGYTYPADKLTTLPVYSLITRADDYQMAYGYYSSDRINQNTTSVENQETGRRYNWTGTFVYEGKVYDHIGYRMRGGNGRYNNGAGGKRSMKLRFNRGNYLQARDIYGKKFPSKWKNLNFGKMFGNHIPGNTNYPYGLNEILNMRLFSQVGVPSPSTWWFHFRVVDGEVETPTDNNGQYLGDFNGLYVAFENYDSAFLARYNLPKGNLYKLSDKVFDGLEQLRYQGPDSVTNAEDYTNMRFNLSHEASADFIEEYLDYDEWFRYHTISEAIRHYDVFSGSDCWHCMKNMAWYFLPVFTDTNPYGKLWFLPFDVDDTWGPYWNSGVDHARAAIYDQRYTDYGLEQFTVQPEKSRFRQEYRNYIREFRDLHWQEDVINGQIDELASYIRDFIPADRDRWSYDYTTGSPINCGDFDTAIARMKQFAWESGVEGWPGTDYNLDSLANSDGDSGTIPNTPVISYAGVDGYPENNLQFSVSNFSDPQGNDTFAAMKWRIAEYDLDFNIVANREPTTDSIVLVNSEETWKYFKGTQEASDPIDAWRYLGYSDDEWLTGQTSIGYSDGDDNTVLADMRYNYSTIYLRKTFEVDNLANIESLLLWIWNDDGCIIWINGVEVARPRCSTARYDDGIYRYNAVCYNHEAANEYVTITDPASVLVEGDNIIAIHAVQQAADSSDCSIDVALVATTVTPVETDIALSKTVKYELDPIWESADISTFSSTYRFPAEDIKPGRNYRVRCKMMDTTGKWSHWSEPVEFVAGEAVGSDIRDNFRMTELMYNLGDAEFMEFKNTSPNTTIDISNVSISGGVDFDFAGSSITSLAPGEFVLVVKDQGDFEDYYGTGFSSRIAGEYDGKLSNGGEDLKIEDFWNGTLFEFEYNDGRGWPIAADGSGHSLVPVDGAIEDQPNGTLDYGDNWRASSYIGGSPAADDPALPATSLVINEFMAHTDYVNPAYPEYDSNDWIELYNAGSTALSLNSNWYLSDDIDELDKWQLPSASIASDNTISYDELTGFHSPITSGFGLDKAGEKIYLSYLPGTAGQDRIVDAITFAGQANSVSSGRYPDGGKYWFSFVGGTRNSSNVSPAEHVIISEIMYHHETGNDNLEYIEVYNPTGIAVDLWTEAGPWALEGGVDYQLPANISLSAGHRILFVGFDPEVGTDLDAFMNAYGITGLKAGTNVFGPWSGNLSNNSDRITLCGPQDSDDLMAPDELSWITVDQCIYNDFWPWDSLPDGLGYSLSRRNNSTDVSSDNPANWTSSNATPGY